MDFLLLMVQKSGHDHQGCCPLSGSGLWGPTPSIHHHVSRSRPSCEPILQVELGAKQGSLYDTPPNLLETKKKGEILETHHTFCNCLILIAKFRDFPFPFHPCTICWRFGGKNSPSQTSTHPTWTSNLGPRFGPWWIWRWLYTKWNAAWEALAPRWTQPLGTAWRKRDVMCVCHVWFGDSCR